MRRMEKPGNDWGDGDFARPLTTGLSPPSRPHVDPEYQRQMMREYAIGTAKLAPRQIHKLRLNAMVERAPRKSTIEHKTSFVPEHVIGELLRVQPLDPYIQQRRGGGQTAPAASIQMAKAVKRSRQP